MKAVSRFLIVETSERVGQVALAEGEQVLSERRLDEARRHARDLVPKAKELLDEQGWKARELTGVIVSRGPGSYTGLRVGIMSAKTLAYATGCALIAVDTFAAIARQAPAEALRVDVLADAQQQKFYVQSFGRTSAADLFVPLSALSIRPLSELLAGLAQGTWLSGPGVDCLREPLPAHVPVVSREKRCCQVGSLLALGLARFHRGERDDPFCLEPLYLRPSSAEEKWTKARATR